MSDTLSFPSSRIRSRFQPRQVAIGAAVVVLAVLVAAGGYVLSLRGQVEKLNAALVEQTNLVVSTKKSLNDQAAAAAEASKLSTHSLALVVADAANLKLGIEAFARQAAACDQVKRQLNTSE